MLSSGTVGGAFSVRFLSSTYLALINCLFSLTHQLNLKFMKRNLVATANPSTNEKNDASTDAKASSHRLAADRKGKQRQSETKVVYEDSLMGFPVIYGFSSPADDVSTSAFAGRRSFGNFNTAVEVSLISPPSHSLCPDQWWQYSSCCVSQKVIDSTLRL